MRRLTLKGGTWMFRSLLALSFNTCCIIRAAAFSTDFGTSFHVPLDPFITSSDIGSTDPLVLRTLTFYLSSPIQPPVVTSNLAYIHNRTIDGVETLLGLIQLTSTAEGIMLRLYSNSTNKEVMLPVVIIPDNWLTLYISFPSSHGPRLSITPALDNCLETEKSGALSGISLAPCTATIGQMALPHGSNTGFLKRARRQTTNNKADTNTSGGLSPGALAAAIVVPILVVIAAAVGGYFLYRWLRSRRSGHGVYEPNAAESNAKSNSAYATDVMKNPTPERLI